MSLQYRQGDLLFVQQEGRPPVQLVPQAGNVILAGEATGHAHRLQDGTILQAPGGELYLDLARPSQVTHEEHQPITLAAGLWLVVRQREYTPGQFVTVED